MFANVAGVTVLGEPSGADDALSLSSSLSLSKGTRDNFWLSSILVDPAEAGFSAEHLRVALAAEAIEARPLWKPMHLQPIYAGARSFVDGTSERLFLEGLSLPSGSVLTRDQVARIDAVIADFLAAPHVVDHVREPVTVPSFAWEGDQL